MMMVGRCHTSWEPLSNCLWLGIWLRDHNKKTHGRESVGLNLQRAPVCQPPLLSSSGVLWGPCSAKAHAPVYRPFISASAATAGSQCLAAKMGLCGARRSQSPKATGHVLPWHAEIPHLAAIGPVLFNPTLTFLRLPLVHSGVVTHSLLFGVFFFSVFLFCFGEKWPRDRSNWFLGAGFGSGEKVGQTACDTLWKLWKWNVPPAKRSAAQRDAWVYSFFGDLKMLRSAFLKRWQVEFGGVCAKL